MKRLIVILVLCALAPLGYAQDAQDTQSALPVLPGPEWIPLDVATVEGAAGFDELEDVYERAGRKWRASPIYLSYPGSVVYEGTRTFADLRANVGLLRERLAGSPRFAEGNGPRMRQHLLSELDALLGRIDALANREGALTWDDTKQFIDDRFQTLSADWKGRTVDGATADLSTDSAYFAARPSQVVLRVDINRDPGGLGSFESWAYFATLEQAIEFRTVVSHVLEIFNAFQLPKWRETSVRLAEIDKAWGNYLEQGFSQYAWESMFNSRVTDFSWTEPPRSQWVLAHPEVGFVMDARESSGAIVEPGLLLHAIGYIRYFGERNEWFTGVSATGSITGNSAFGAGYGATIHFGHTKTYQKVPHVSLSLLWQDYGNGPDGIAIGINLDLWRYISDGGDDFYRSVLGERLPDVQIR